MKQFSLLILGLMAFYTWVVWKIFLVRPKDLVTEGDVDMAKKKAPKSKSKVAKVMREYKHGELKSGKSKKPVKKRTQAIAIALSEARKAGEDVQPPLPGSPEAKKVAKKKTTATKKKAAPKKRAAKKTSVAKKKSPVAKKKTTKKKR